jgi:DNA-binding FadR family transcriptional regulator
MKGIESEFAVDKLERELIHSILVGDYRADDLMPSIDQLCQYYQLSYHTVRNAIGRLAARGLIVALPGRPARIVDLQASIDLKLLFEIIDTAGCEPGRRWNLLAQTCGYLKFMLNEIADRAARHRDDDQLEWFRHMIRALTDAIAVQADRSTVGHCELQLWRILAAASGCVTNTAVVNSMRAFVLGSYLVEKHQTLVPIDEYWAISEALATNDAPRAREVMDAAIARLENRCIDELKKLGWSETPTGATPG